MNFLHSPNCPCMIAPRSTTYRETIYREIYTISNRQGEIKMNGKWLISKGLLVCSVLFLCAIVDCGGGGAPTQNQPPPIKVALTPSSPTTLSAGEIQFMPTVSGTSDQRVSFAVNGVTGGNSTVGTITSSGDYIAPEITADASVTVTATSVADQSKSSSANVTVAARKIAAFDKPVVVSDDNTLLGNEMTV